MEAKDRIICALDVDDLGRAVHLVAQLKHSVGVFKVGLELVNSAGIQAFERLRQAGAGRVFYDAKLHDIPNTVAGAMRGIARLGVWCVTVHAGGGKAMLRAAVEAGAAEASARGMERPKILAVTLLTSISAEALQKELRIGLSPAEYVAQMARMAQEAGCDGVIASPQEIGMVRRAISNPDFLVITPGVRPAGAEIGDQARVMTPCEAISAGADYLVIGRPIVAAMDPLEAAHRIAAEIELA